MMIIKPSQQTPAYRLRSHQFAIIFCIDSECCFHKEFGNNFLQRDIFMMQFGLRYHHQHHSVNCLGIPANQITSERSYKKPPYRALEWINHFAGDCKRSSIHSTFLRSGRIISNCSVFNKFASLRNNKSPFVGSN